MTEQISELMSNEITFDPHSGFMNVDIEFRERVTRCRDCSHCKPTTDGRRYCALRARSLRELPVVGAAVGHGHDARLRPGQACGGGRVLALPADARADTGRRADR